MPLILRPMRPSDLRAFDDILVRAFDSGIMRLTHPAGYTEPDRLFTIRRTFASLADPCTRYTVVVDTDLRPPETHILRPDDLPDAATAAEGPDSDPPHRVVGIAIWKVHPRDRSPAELAAAAAESANEPFAPTVDVAAYRAFRSAVAEAKNKYLGGRAHVLLHVLATDPEHHRRGVGAMQLRVGLEEADRLGVCAYLEASAMGKGLYERWGWREVGMLEFGREEGVEHTIMIRPGLRETGEEGEMNGHVA